MAQVAEFVLPPGESASLEAALAAEEVGEDLGVVPRIERSRSRRLLLLEGLARPVRLVLRLSRARRERVRARLLGHAVMPLVALHALELALESSLLAARRAHVRLLGAVRAHWLQQVRIGHRAVRLDHLPHHEAHLGARQH